MAIQNTQEMFIHDLGDIYDAEHRFLKGQQEMLQKASDQQLQSMIKEHITQTEQQIKNLDQVFSLLGSQAKGVKCDAAAGLVTEAQKTVQETNSTAICDSLIDGALAKVEHYEIASYRGLVGGAQMMGKQDVMHLLQQNLSQEEQTAQRLEQAAPQLLQKAMQAEGMTTGASVRR